MSATDSNPDQLLTRRALKHQRTPARRRRQKILALTAGGLVLGVGATATVAAWTDETFSTGQFQAGSFAIEANIDGTWQSTNTMQFTAQQWFPGHRDTAAVLIRTSPDTTVDGELTVTGQGATGQLSPYFEYRATTTNLTTTKAEAFNCRTSLDAGSGCILVAKTPTFPRPNGDCRNHRDSLGWRSHLDLQCRINCPRLDRCPQKLAMLCCSCWPHRFVGTNH